MSKAFFLTLLTVCLIVSAQPALGNDIHGAIEAGNVEGVKAILKTDPASINTTNPARFNELPIHAAARTGNLEIVRLLLDAETPVDAGDSDNSTALDVAAMMGHGPLVAFFIENGADINHRDRNGACPISFAVNSAKEDIARRLADAGADLSYCNGDGETLLHLSCSRRMPLFASYLLDHGIGVNVMSNHGITPLGSAALAGNAEIVKLLLDRGADVNPEGENARNPLLFTAWRNNVDCAKLLLEKGADVNKGDDGGRSPLIGAARSSALDMVNLLIEHGASINGMTELGETPLVLASGAGCAGAVKALLDAKADPNIGDDGSGRNALQLASICGYPEIARLLIASGAKIDAAGSCGETPLQLARYYGNGDVAGILEKSGAPADKAKKIDRSAAAFGKIGDEEAVIWFLGHSGWAIKTKNHFLVFDYWPNGARPSKPGLCNGWIDPAEIKGGNVEVFASHFHQDHYSPEIFSWKEEIPGVEYFLGLRPRDQVPPFEYMEGRMEKSYGDIKLTTIPATDAGVGMVIEVDGLTIFHAGDHTNGKDGMMTEFSDEIDYLKNKGIKPDICFMGILGCSLGNPPQVRDGVIYTLETLKPKVFIPMHAQTRESDYRTFIDGIKDRFESIQMAVPGNRGDHFVYSKGKFTDPRGEAKSRLTNGPAEPGKCATSAEGCSAR